MNPISEGSKKRILEFIDQNDLDYTDFESDVIKFTISSYDGTQFNIYEENNEFMVVKIDPRKAIEQVHNSGVQAHEYYRFQNLSQLLERFRSYDESLIKRYWTPVLNSTNDNFDKRYYSEDWFSDLNISNYQVVETDSYKYISYTNESIKPRIISPFNTLYEISPINKREVPEINKLYLEIHPVSCKRKNESYLVKILCNNEDVLKEYVHYTVVKKKGLRLFLGSISKEVGLDKL